MLGGSWYGGKAHGRVQRVTKNKSKIGAIAVLALFGSSMVRLGEEFLAMHRAWTLPGVSSIRSKFKPAMMAATQVKTHSQEGCYVGIDFGTSGARATAIDNAGNVLAESRQLYPASPPEAVPEVWKKTLYALIMGLPADIRSRVDAIALDATTSTCFLVDKASERAITAPKMYYDKCDSSLPFIETIAPPGHIVLGATSTLCKLVSWVEDGLVKGDGQEILMHQNDWLGYWLHGIWGATDSHNALKLGYNPDPSLGNGLGAYPSWLTTQKFAGALPRSVYLPGQAVGLVQPKVAELLGLPADALICSGTVDAIAALVAAKPTKVGQAVVSLGSSLVILLLSDTRVDSAEFGIQSYRLGNLWLVEGASNVGPRVLREFFTDTQLQDLSEKIDPEVESPLDYYPLPAKTKGERFPENNPNMMPRLEPRPKSDVEFLHGLLESISKIEKKGFDLMKSLGASAVTEVYTAGGGAKNNAWSKIRMRNLGVKVYPADQAEASYGAAMLAQQGHRAK